MHRMILLIALLCATKSALLAASILTGSLSLGGAPEIDSRGYGRGIGFDLRAADGLFTVACGNGDTLSVSPGSISGSTAIPQSNPNLGRCFPLFVSSATPSTFGVFTNDVMLIDAVPVRLPTLPAPEPYAFIDFDLPATRFTMRGHLTVVEFFTEELLIDSDVIGSGRVFMSGRYARFEGDPFYYIHRAEFIFDDVPEPATLFLVLAGGVVVIGRSRLRRNAGA